VDPGADDDPAAGEGTERRRYELACGREDDRCVELLGRGLVRGPGPFAAELERERRGRVVAGPDEAEDAPPLVPRDLDDDVGRRAEAVETEPLGIACEAKGPVAEMPGVADRNPLIPSGPCLSESSGVPALKCQSPAPIESSTGTVA